MGGNPALMIAFGKPHKGPAEGDDTDDYSEHEGVAKDIIGAVKSNDKAALAMALTRFIDLHNGGASDDEDSPESDKG